MAWSLPTSFSGPLSHPFYFFFFGQRKRRAKTQHSFFSLSPPSVVQYTSSQSVLPSFRLFFLPLRVLHSLRMGSIFFFLPLTLFFSIRGTARS